MVLVLLFGYVFHLGHGFLVIGLPFQFTQNRFLWVGYRALHHVESLTKAMVHLVQ